MTFSLSSPISQQGKYGRSDSTKRDGCNDCEVNTKAENPSSVECEQCGSGRSAAKKGSATCSACQAGQFKDMEEKNCNACPTGWAQPDQDQDNCLLCGKDLEKGKGATTGQTAEEKKDDKEWKGKANCQLCDLGQFGPPLQDGTCEICGAGKYQDGKGQRACLDCPVNTYSNEEGKSSNADCTACPEKTTTNEIKGRTEESACVCKDSFYRDPSSATLACVSCIKEQTNCR